MCKYTKNLFSLFVYCGFFLIKLKIVVKSLALHGLALLCSLTASLRKSFPVARYGAAKKEQQGVVVNNHFISCAPTDK